MRNKQLIVQKNVCNTFVSHENVRFVNKFLQIQLIGNTQFFHRVKFDYDNYQSHCYFPLVSHILEIIPERDFNETA